MKDLSHILKTIPKLPWVYQFFDAKGVLLYIWKSVNLHSRVGSYFNGKSKLNFAKKKMVWEIETIKTLVTNTPRECLILETSLIKKHKPKYNILMKDDKNHTYIKITNEFFPKVIKTRIKSKKDDGALYFGPYISTQYVNHIIALTKKIFWHRSSPIVFDSKDRIPKSVVEKLNLLTEDEYKNSLLPKEKRNPRYSSIYIKQTGGAKIPSLEYYIGRSKEPGLLTYEQMKWYNDDIKHIIEFLWWDIEKIIQDLKQKMQHYAQNLEFEQAQKTKTDIEALESLKETQIVRDIVGYDVDIINYLEKYDSFFLSKIEVRDQKITWIYNFEIKDTLKDPHECVQYFIEKQYGENKKKLTLILPEAINIEKEFLDELKIKIEVPKIGEKTDILWLAYKNAFEFAYKKHLEWLSVKWFTKKDMQDLLEILWYTALNKDIIFECNDISHISGNHTVASRSVIENGKPTNAKYRKFKIKTLNPGEINDFDSMREIMTRRILEIKKTWFVPDLIIIDGGKWQLSSVVEILEKEKLKQENKEFVELFEKIQLVSLAKKEEELFLPYAKESILISKDSNILRMIQKIRDEAHRFAITFNRDSRIKSSKKNILEELPGIGPKTRQKLLKHYGNIEAITLDDALKKILSKSQIETLESHGIV